MKTNKRRTGKREHHEKREGRRNREGKERVVRVRLRPSRMRADAGKEPETRGETQGHWSTAVYCQAVAHLD